MTVSFKTTNFKKSNGGIMNRNIKYVQMLIKQLILPLCLCCLGLTACTVEEELIADSSNNNTTSEASVNFSLLIPSQMQVQTRAPLDSFAGCGGGIRRDFNIENETLRR